MAVDVQVAPDGVRYRATPPAVHGWRLENSPPEDTEVVSFAAQLEELGLAEVAHGGNLLLPWGSVYRVLDDADFVPSSRVLPVPAVDDSVVPALSSTGSLSDPRFRIAITGWHRQTSGHIADRLDLIGPVSRDRGLMLSEAVFRLVLAVSAFQRRDAAERTAEGNRLAWGAIRDLALAADAVLDRFLRDTIVLRPTMLSLGMDRIHVGDDVAVRVAPTFDRAPDAWLNVFDRAPDARQLYQVVDGAGGYHEIIVEEPVLEVLREIKRLPQRTATGARARRLIDNPIAFFGGIEHSIFDEAAVESELRRLRDSAYAFQPQIALSPDGSIDAVGVELQPVGADSDAPGEVRLFANPGSLEQFIERSAVAPAAGNSFFAWSGFEIEVDARTSDHIELLRSAWNAWRSGDAVATPTASDDPEGARQAGGFLIDASLVLDLSRYYGRVEAIGIETPYGIISIPLTQKGAWLPDDQELRFLLDGGADGEATTEMNRDELRQFVQSVADCVSSGRSAVPLPRGGSLPIAAARDLVDALPRGLREELREPLPARSAHERRPRTGLLIKPNINHEDFVATRAAQLHAPGNAAALVPAALRAGTKLKDHQRRGLVWLQHLLSESPSMCRGALLADDMGLGKTLQLLCLIARAREDDPDLKPALVVAPVTLLENWLQEVDRFFQPNSLPVRTLYGPELRAYRVHRDAIDDRLQEEGLRKFLRPGWHDGVAIVLTTYETLRDYEFSFADVDWSIVACDEAQRIKNPNALVSRAAKKLKANFCIAATGTPVENNLTDLWSIFDFIQPGLLEPLNVFNRRYRRPIEARTDTEKERLEHLRRVIDPQILRRTKEQVARDLPAKVFSQECRELPMSTRQRELYAAALAGYHGIRDSATGTEMLELLGVLRRICTDPRARHELEDAPPPLHEYRKKAPKLDWLLHTLEGIRRKEEKAIIFLDRKDIQRLVQAYVRDCFGFAPEIINGDTPTGTASADSRQRRIDRFQAQPGFSALILSPVAAGVGLNIQQANHVIHYMRHWNPAKEDQATDRAYRIGQARDVHVYTPIVIGDGLVSFDERLDELLEKKRAIAADVLNGSDDIGAAEFAELFDDAAQAA